MNKLKVTINGKVYHVEPGQTVLEVAKKNGIEIPALCFHPDFPVKGNCRVCSVEVKGYKRLVPSCATTVCDCMEVQTETARVKKARNMNLELIFAEHIEKCPSCIWRFQCPLLGAVKKYGVKLTRFRDRKGARKIYKFQNAVEIDGSQCIDCKNCVEACAMQQNINYLKFTGKGSRQEVVPRQNEGFKCILCGQCALHCPVSAAQEQAEVPQVEKILEKRKRFLKTHPAFAKASAGKPVARHDKEILVAQFAPSVRVTIGEDFNLPYGKDSSGKITAALKKLGFDYVFDINFGADLTTIIEAEELLERIKDKKARSNGSLPMFTSCCPGWVNYVELLHPEIIPHLTTTRSPHVHLAGVVKTFWAKKMGVDPKNIKLVSIMPCTAKKYEAVRPELKVDGMQVIDQVLTTRELSFLFKKNNIDLAKIKPQDADDPLGRFSGAAALFGGSGGVMESALRTADYLACGSNTKAKLCRAKIDYNEARGLAGIKTAEVDIAGNKVRIAVVNGIGNIDPIIADLDKFDYIEVMACPGGCIGGGGQPIPTTDEIRSARMQALYQIDFAKKGFRRSYENKGVLEVIDWVKKNKLAKKVLFTKYHKRSV
ncbi:MAG: [Fe-Fe] hydrogenase large subunit C-terminal domain-containing protein [Patescibacteria group bacterium]|nr:[Fe-Fe] hydrogenase large subunit C-terminal domain-containing protein [Patescibacteria group bacterium]